MRKILISLFVIISMLGISKAALASSIIVFQPDNIEGKDAQIQEGLAANLGDFSDLLGNYGGSPENRGLIEFDLSTLGSVVVNNAVLSLSHTGNRLHGAQFGVFRILEAWDESTVIWDNAPIASDVLASVLTIDDENLGFRDWDVTNIVQDWVFGIESNYGMMVRRLDQSNPLAFFASSDSSVGQRPKLTINYSTVVSQPIPEPATLVLLGSGLLGAGILRRKRR